MPNAKAGEVKAPCTLTSRSTHLQKPAPTLLRCWLNTPPELLPTQQGGPNSRVGRAVHRSRSPKFPNVGPTGKRATSLEVPGSQNPPLSSIKTTKHRGAGVTVCQNEGPWWARGHNLYFCAAKRQQLKLKHFSTASLLTLPQPPNSHITISKDTKWS